MISAGISKENSQNSQNSQRRITKEKIDICSAWVTRLQGPWNYTKCSWTFCGSTGSCGNKVQSTWQLMEPWVKYYASSFVIIIIIFGFNYARSMMIIMYLALTLDVVEFQYVTFKIPSKNMQLQLRNTVRSKIIQNHDQGLKKVLAKDILYSSCLTAIINLHGTLYAIKCCDICCAC